MAAPPACVRFQGRVGHLLYSARMTWVRFVLCRPWLIWGLAAVVAYAPSVRASVRSLTEPAGGGDVLAPGVTAASQLGAAATLAVIQLLTTAAALTLLVCGPAWHPVPIRERARQLGLRWQDGRRRLIGGTVGETAGYVAILTGAMFIAAVVLSGLEVTGRPTVGGSIPSPLLMLGDYLMSIGAGIGEELLLLAIPYALAVRAGWKPWAIIVLLTGLRLSIHLYYGAGALFVVLWIPAAYLLYRAIRSIFPLICGHIVYDLLATTEERSPAVHTPALALLVGLGVLGSALLVGSAARHLTPAGSRSLQAPNVDARQ